MINEIPSEVAQIDIEESESFDERMAAINCLFANIIGVNESTVEWCPNNEPPEKDERFAWLWLIRPSMGTTILPNCSPELGKLINAYSSKKMANWFENIAT